MNRTSSNFTIRAELPDGQCRDFAVNATSNGRTPAFRVAREIASDHFAREFGVTVRLEWRGMVVFVNRSVPLG